MRCNMCVRGVRLVSAREWRFVSAREWPACARGVVGSRTAVNIEESMEVPSLSGNHCSGRFGRDHGFPLVRPKCEQNSLHT